MQASCLEHEAVRRADEARADRADSAAAGLLRFSCVVDAASIFQLQAYTLVASLLECARVPASDIVVHAVAPLAPELAQWLDARGVAVVHVPRHRHAYCNKLQQLVTFAGQANGHVVLLDCDTFVTREAQWPRPAAVAAKPVDSARPPTRILAELIQEAGLAPRWAESDLVDGPEGGRVTLEGNCNGGVYVIAAAVLPALAAAWQRWADWLLERAERFGEFALHIDQVSFAFAVHELGLALERLPRAFNCPTHIPLPPDEDVDPVLLHYHRQLDQQLFLLPAGSARVDAAIAAANARIAAWRGAHLPNALWFGTRYRLFPDLDSGGGLAGATLHDKQQLLLQLTEQRSQAPVLEIGCGNLAVSQVLTTRDYLGVDAADTAVAQARARRPDWQFVAASVQDPVLAVAPREIVLCLDVLIHQCTRSDYDRMVARLAALTGELLIVSGYDAPPRFASSISYFHEPLSASLVRAGFDETVAVGGDRDVVVFAARRSAAARSGTLAGAALTQVALQSDRALPLWRVAELARAVFGGLPADPCHALACAWVAQCAGEGLDGQITLAIEPRQPLLARWLAERGAAVARADFGTALPALVPAVNAAAAVADDPRILPLPVTEHGFAVDVRFDLTVCVGLLEHVSPALRAAWVQCLAAHSTPGGRLLTAVELLPFSARLAGAPAAFEDNDLAALHALLAAAGWRVVAQHLRERVAPGLSGLALIEATRTSDGRE